MFKGKQLRDWLLRRPVEVLIFALLWGTSAYFYQSTQHNEAARFDQMRALLEEHRLAIDSYWWNTADIIHYPKAGTDHIYPNKAPGGTIVGLFPYAVVTTVLRLCVFFGLPVWVYWHLVCYFTVLSTVSFVSALAAVAMYRATRHVTGDSYFAMVSVLTIWLGTLALPYSTLFFSHQLTGALLSLAFAQLFLWKQSHADGKDDRSTLTFFGAGLCAGLSVISEYPTAIILGLLSVYVGWLLYAARATKPRRSVLAASFAGGLLVAALLLLGYNRACFGKLAYVPIEAYASPASAFPTHARGILGFSWNGFPHFAHALSSVTTRPRIGMLYLGFERWVPYGCSPVLWLALPGLVALLWHKNTRAEGVLVTAMTISYFLFITSYGTAEYDWAGGSYFGTRHLIPLLGVLALPIAAVAHRARYLVYPLLAVSIFYMLLGTAVEPRIGYPTENPHRDIFLPEFLRGHFAQNTAALFDDGNHLLTPDSTAFNLGKLVHLAPRVQLAPLMLWWLIVGGALVIVASNWRRPSAEWLVPRMRLGGVFAFVALVTLLPVIHHAAYGGHHQRAGLFARYFRNATWSGRPTEVQVDSKIDFDWSKSFPLQPPFSVEWSGTILVEQKGPYAFSLIADDGAELEIDGQVVVDALNVVLEKRTGRMLLGVGTHRIRVRYFNALFGGSVRLTYTPPGQPEQVVPPTVLSPKAR